VVDQVHSALSVDSSKSTHPLSHDVNSPSEIRSMFSTISYDKGASILRMIEKSYGEKVFYEALSNYLNDRWVSRKSICCGNAKKESLGFHFPQKYFDLERSLFFVL